MVAHVINLSTQILLTSANDPPVAEKIFRQLRDVSEQHPDVHCIAISHSDKSATDKWLQDVGGSGKIEVLIDDEMKTFAEYGLGYSSFWAVLNPSSLSAAMNIGKNEGIDIRPTQSGSRWQTAGLFAVDGRGQITYSHPAKTSDDLGDLKEALQSIK